jgi:hypothetical protein
MIKCGGERIQGSTFLAWDLVQSDAEIERWNDVCFSGFLSRKVSKNLLYIGYCFFDS